MSNTVCENTNGILHVMRLERSEPEKNLHESGMLAIDSPLLQRAVISLWGERMHEDLRGNDLAEAWITRGMAAQYRDYIDEHSGETVDPGDIEQLNTILNEVERTVH